ncbi:MAG: tape measure protein [Prevotella sp.]|nr:tape measure protein [Prevotella sp.]
MAGIKFDITGDNSNLLRSLEGARNGVTRVASDIEKSGLGIEEVFKRVAATAGIAFSVAQAKNFVAEIARVRGDFQQIEIALTTMLGSTEKSSALIGQLVKTAAITPFDMKGIVDGAKQLLAYGVAAENVNNVLVHLGDIAAGLSLPLNDLVYLYGTTMTQGRMFTEDYKQFMGRGIPLADELAKQFGVTKDKVGELVTAGKVGAEEFNNAIMSMSSKGGKFGGLMEEQSKSITGQISNIEDAISMMFNNIGKQQEGTINSALDVVSSLVENYETVGKVLAGLIVTYGTYRTAVMVLAAAQNLQAAGVSALTAREVIHLGWIKATTVAQKALNATMLTNPYVLLATAIGGLVAVMVTMKDEQDMINDSLEEYENQKQRTIEKEEKHRAEIEKLMSIAQDESLSTENRRVALVKLEQQYPSIFAKYDTQYEKLVHIRDINREIAELEGRESIKNSQNELFSVNKRINELRKKGEATYRTQTLESGLAMTVQTGGRTAKENAEFKALLQKQRELNKEISKNETSDYLANLTGISNKDLQREIDNRRNLLARMDLDNKKYGEITRGGGKGVFSQKEIEGQIGILTAEQNRRNEKKSTPSSIKSSLLKDLNDAKNALADFDKSSSKYTIAEAEDKRKKLKAAVDDAEKKYKEFGGSVDKKTSSTKTDNDRKHAREQLTKDLEKIEQQHADNEISIQEESTEKKLAAIKNEYDKTIAEINRKEKEFQENNKKAGTTGLNQNGLTDRQENALQALRDDAAKTQDKQTQEIYRSEIESMRSYLQEYGTYQQQKLAIAQEYAEKIAKAQNEGERLTLEKQRDKAMRDKADEQVISKVDWVAAFGNLGTAFESVIKDTLAELNAYIQTDEFRSRSAEDKQTILDAQKNLQGKVSNDATFEKLNKQIEAYRVNVQTLSMAEKVHQSAINDLTAAEQQRDSITDKNSKEYADASEKVVNAQKEVERTAGLVTTAGDSVAEAQGRVSSTAVQLQGNLEKMSQGISQLSNGTLAGTVSGLENLIKSFGGSTAAIDKFKDLLKTGLSAIFGEQVGGMMAESLDIVEGVLTGDMTEAVVSGVLGMVDNILEGILKGGIITKPVQALVSGLGSIANTITFGGFNSLFDTSNAKEVAETTERLTRENERLRSSVDNLKNEMANQGGKRAFDTYNAAVKNQERVYNNQMEVLKAQMGYHGSHHSNAYYWGLGKNEYSQLNALLAEYANKNPDDKNAKQKSVSSLNDIYKLTPEQMAYIRTYNVDLWNTMLSQGKYDKSEYWDAYADLAGEMKEISESFKESLTQISFDSLKSNFASSLMDMTKDVDDFKNDMSKKLAESVLNAKISDLLEDELRAFYDDWANRSKDGLSDADVSALQEQYQALVQKGFEIRDEAAKITGYDTSSTYKQEASSKGYAAASQDEVGELNGRFTAVQIASEKVAENMISVVALMTSFSSSMTTNNETLVEIRNLIIIGNSYLEDVAKYSKNIYRSFGEKIDKLIEQTK